jgi:hypothetical protein
MVVSLSDGQTLDDRSPNFQPGKLALLHQSSQKLYVRDSQLLGGYLYLISDKL